MAKRKNPGVTGLVIGAIVVGIVVGIIIVNPRYSPAVNVEVDSKDIAYNHAEGAIARVNKAKVSHILISYKTAKSPTPGLKDKNRTEEQARKLAEEIWAKYREAEAADKEKVWKELQAQYNEDKEPHTEYDVTPEAGWIQEFKDIGLTTAVGAARITMPPGKYGYHVIRRIE